MKIRNLNNDFTTEIEKEKLVEINNPSSSPDTWYAIRDGKDSPIGITQENNQWVEL